MTPRSPLVGVVVPVLNVEPWLERMLSSLRRQTFPNWSAVVVDDGSNDDTLAVAQAQAALDSRLAVTSNAERGPGARLARILGSKLLPREIDYLYFPDGDDVLEPQLLERLVERLESRPDAAAAFCSYSTIDEHDGPVDVTVYERLTLSRRWVRSLNDSDEDTPFATLYSEAPAWEGLTMFRKSSYDESGGLEESPAWASHTVLDLLLRMSKLGRIVFVAEVLYRRRERPGQMSGTAGLIATNGKALRRRWRERAAGDPSLSSSLAQGEFLLRHRATPQRRLRRAVALARRGNLPGAAPRVLLALLSYRWRIPSVVRASVDDAAR